MVDINVTLSVPLIEKMWQTFDKRFIAPWMNPKRIQREGEAQLQLDRKRRLQEIELESAKIHSEKIQITHSESGSLARVEPHVDFGRLAEIEQKQDYVRKQINLGKSILHAETEITADDPIPEKEVEADWLYRWKEYAEKFSTDDMQLLWGKVLAGEFKRPGAFSYRALEVLSNLSKEDAEDFLLLCSLSFSYSGLVFVFDESEINKKYGLFHLKILRLQEAMLLSYTNSSINFDERIVAYSDKHKKMIEFSGDGKKSFGVIFFTEIGEAIYDLIDECINLTYIRDNLSSLLEKKKITSLLANEAFLSPDKKEVRWNRVSVEEFK